MVHPCFVSAPGMGWSTVYGAVACLKADEASDSYAERQVVCT